MVVDEEGEIAQGSQLVRERLGELAETSLQTAAALERGCELLAELRGVATQRTDQIGEQDERIFVATLQGQPGRAFPGRAQEVGVLGEDGRLSEAGRGMHERQSVTLGAFQTIEQALPPEQRKR
jgi:hypothetical protein